MAQIIRHDYRLPTLRISMQFKKSEPFIQFRTYHGRQELAAELISAHEVGISERLSLDRYRHGWGFVLPPEIIMRLDDELKRVRHINQPVWLQIDRSAGYLAVVPWERLLAPFMKGPFLRIPNFLVDPIFSKGRLALVVCASAPAAKGLYPVAAFTIELIERIQQAVIQGTDVHVFTDAGSYQIIQQRFRGRTSRIEHTVTVHDPKLAIPFGTGESQISESKRLQSPWLRWIKAALDNRSIDVAHFVCPGFFETDRGSLALARSPIENVDKSWSHFVGGPELCTFLDALGVETLVLGAPYNDIWALGLRLLADEIAWTRPGPVSLYETRDYIDAASQVYSFLFSERYAQPLPEGGELLLYCHPRRLERYDMGHEAVFESATFKSDDPGHEWLYSAAQEMGRKGGRDAQKAEANHIEPHWARANRLMIEQSFLEVSRQHGASARGAAVALRFLSRLQEKYLLEGTQKAEVRPSISDLEARLEGKDREGGE